MTVARFAAVRLAVGTLTVLPAGPVQVDRRVAGRAMVLAPLAVLPVAIAATGLGWLVRLAAGPSLLAGLVVVAGLAVGTRAIHLDGLADTVDGLGSGRPAAGALEIMRHGDVGPMGVVALVLVLAAQAVAFGELAGSWRGAVATVVVICTSRWVLALLCEAGVPAARTDGLGAAVVGSVSTSAVGLTGLAAFHVAALAGWLASGWALTGMAAFVLAWVAGWGLRRTCVRRLGGITGDVLGAGVEVYLTVLSLGVLLGAGVVR